VIDQAMRTMLVGDFWEQFHRLWGAARDGTPYEKHAWALCHETIADILASCGLERRQQPRRLHDPQ
jgi:hypothetical protein